MFLELIAAFASAFAAAGVVMVINVATKGRLLPKWATPVAAGAAMLAYGIWSEYSWYSRASHELPEGVYVTFANENSSMWKPWTYVLPYVDRFVAVDTLSIRTNAEVPHQRLADAYFYGRWSPRRGLTLVVDCAEQKIAPLPSATLGETGEVIDAAWTRPVDGDTTVEAACT